ncbi:MAG: response regulator [Candidatus Margulisiibacteriota bacterium]|jgi:DNA-binding response OmpR family regulator
MAEEKKIKVLVVDDEPDVVSLLEVLLNSYGYSVISAADGQQALEKARTERPDLIILDVMLPKLDGYKVARMLKFDENFSKIPIIMLTAKVTDKDKETGIETGADVYLTKPFETDKLLASIETVLRKYSQNP